MNTSPKAPFLAALICLGLAGLAYYAATDCKHWGSEIGHFNIDKFVCMGGFEARTLEFLTTLFGALAFSFLLMGVWKAPQK
ncbi:MAG: hypothetical protein AAFP79_10405 [Pseudomonadota bacterium]